MIVTGTHNPYLVAFSILVALFASYTALDLGGHVAATRGLARHMWLVAAAITMGGGIWSMHFVAMLAFMMPTPMSYDIGLTILSLAVAILVTGGGFYVISRRSASPLRLMLSGICMGLGIAAMHYTGMAAMRVHAQLIVAFRHHPTYYVVASHHCGYCTNYFHTPPPQCLVGSALEAAKPACSRMFLCYMALALARFRTPDPILARRLVPLSSGATKSYSSKTTMDFNGVAGSTNAVELSRSRPPGATQIS